jgi:hypothetical protein
MVVRLGCDESTLTERTNEAKEFYMRGQVLAGEFKVAVPQTALSVKRLTAVSALSGTLTLG